MKGKHAAAAATRRAQDSEAEVARLREDLATERQVRSAEVTDLRTQLTALQSRLVREVEALAAERVRDLEATHQEALTQLRAQHHEAGLAVSRWLTANAVTMAGMPSWATLADLLGITFGELLQEDRSHNRRVRRATTRTANIKDDEAKRTAPASFYVKDA